MLANPSQASTRQIARELQLISFQASDPASCSTSAVSPDLSTVCADAISALPEEADAVRKGKKNVLNTIVGRVMKETRGRADAQAVKALLEDMIMKKGK